MELKLFDKENLIEKRKTRKLYEQCFPNDSPNLVDYYYNSLIKRNIIIVLEDNNKIVSMIHLNPYIFNICGNITVVHYLFAIGTDEPYRGKGCMSQLLDYAIEYLKNLKDPFCYLTPEYDVLKNYYKRFGFEEVCNFSFNKFSDAEFDIFPVRNYEYDCFMNKEQEFLSQDPEEYIHNLKKRKVLARTLDDNLDINYLKTKRIYICNEL